MGSIHESKKEFKKEKKKKKTTTSLLSCLLSSAVVCVCLCDVCLNQNKNKETLLYKYPSVSACLFCSHLRIDTTATTFEISRLNANYPTTTTTKTTTTVPPRQLTDDLLRHLSICSLDQNCSLLYLSTCYSMLCLLLPLSSTADLT